MKQKNKSKLTIMSIVFIVLGVLCFIVKSFNPGSIDASGLLVEPFFFLLPVGFAFVFIGVLIGAISFIHYLSKK